MMVQTISPTNQAKYLINDFKILLRKKGIPEQLLQELAKPCACLNAENIYIQLTAVNEHKSAKYWYKVYEHLKS